MNSLAQMRFRGRWRDYQRTVLDELDGHLEDRKLHVVAAPGSGKTILGLEVLRRIGKPAIILAPTVTIRDQWIDRLCEFYLDGDCRPDWVGTSIRSPKPLTVLTYQALDSALRDFEGRPPERHDTTLPKQSKPASAYEAFVHTFENFGQVTLVLDEAHHLRREWWRALMCLKSALQDVQIVALTATPPYDVDPAEWRRYQALCGPMDAEIPIPALVQNGDLCPHQDLIYVSQPTESETDTILAQREQIEQLTLRLQHDEPFLDVLQAHSWLTETDKHIDEVLSAPELQSAMLIFLNSAGRPPPECAIRVLGVADAKLPPLSADMLEVLLNGVLFLRPGDFELGPKWHKQLQADLRQANAIDRGRVRIVQALQYYRTLAGSLAKIGSVVDIARFEAALLKDRLRLVVLTDLVRVRELERSATDLSPTRRLGVVPIFQALREAKIEGVRLAVLSGPLVIVPTELLSRLKELAMHRSAETMVDHHLLSSDKGFASVKIEHLGVAVETLTEMFEAGDINVLIGTQALLGEGWDAPVLNSLVLASNVGSYMLSNQMRGRAIRSSPGHPEKAAIIWHLATVSSANAISFLQPLRNLLGEQPVDIIKGGALGADMAMLARRFQAFEGLSQDSPPRITNGIDRLRLDHHSWTADGIDRLNDEMVVRASERATLRNRWVVALGSAISRQPRMRQVVETEHRPRVVTIDRTLQYLVISGILGGLWAALQGVGRRALSTDVRDVLTLFLGLALLYTSPKLLKAAYLLLRNGTIEGSLGAVCRVLVDSLAEAKRLETPRQQIEIRAERASEGKRLVQVLGATRDDEEQILDALQEVIGPVRNPKYLLMQTSWFGRHRRVDYHSVPVALATKKADAERFAFHWRRRVGNAKLVSLRTLEGRKVLLRARAKSLAAGFQEPFERYSVWQ